MSAQPNQGLILTVDDYYRLVIGLPAFFPDPEQLKNIEALKGNSFRHYLQQATKEKNNEFLKRLLWTPYPNYQKKIVNSYQSYLFANKVIYRSETEGAMPSFEMELFSRSAARHSFVGGCCYALTIEEPKIYTVLQCREVNPGVYHINAGKPDFTIVDENNKTITQGTVETTLEEGQFVKISYDEMSISLLADTAPMNVAIYNHLSVKNAHISRSILYWVTGPSVGDGKEPEPFHYIPTEDGESKVEIASPDVEQIRVIAEDIRGQVIEMGIICGLEEEFGAEVVAGDSAIAHEVRMLDTNAVLTGAAIHIASGVNKVSRYYHSKINKPVVEMTINPRLKVTAKAETLKIINFLLDKIQIDDVAKKLQALAVDIGIGQDISQSEGEEIAKIINAQGGLATTGSTGGMMQVDGGFSL